MTDWKNIGTAPRDGSYIQGRDETGKIFACRWYSRDEIAEYNGSDQPEEWDSAWYAEDDAYEELFPNEWRPLEIRQ
ncbi:MAG: hypothetical protein H7X93_06385 [Sphingomonadaceae bacterium]|nr:hypothetical protein [Sphingomonadaceae bacterium]